MRVEIPYGPGEVTAELPEDAAVIANEPAETMEPLADPDAAARRALDSPIDSPALPELVRPGARVTIAFDDATVASYGPVRGIVIGHVLADLKRAGVPADRVRLICANALHRKFRPAELARLIGQDLVSAFDGRLTCHDAEDPENLVHLGRTPQGYDVETHRAVVESDLTIYVNAGHNRGFSGGWKSICVGLSTYRSIRHHHTPDGMSMSLHNNRMHAMLDEMGRHLEANIGGRIFKVDTLLADPWRPARLFAGSVWGTRRAVIEALEALYPPRRGLSAERFDVALYGVPDWSPYAIFSKMNPLLTLISSGLGYLGGLVQAVGKPGCTLIMVTPCPNQWDRARHPAYPIVWEEVLSSTRDPDAIARDHAERFATAPDLIELYRRDYAFHPVHAILATYPLARLRHVGRVIVAGAVDPSLPRRLGFETTATVEAALALAREIHGPGFRLAYIRQPKPPLRLDGDGSA